MKYLKYREDFLVRKFEEVKINNEIHLPINEEYAFENDITWGGSLLGRLINSTLRKSKLYLKVTKVSGIVNEVEARLAELLTRSIPGAKNITALVALYEVYCAANAINTQRALYSNLSVNERIDQLLDGLIDNAIDLTKKSEIEGKDTIVSSLEKFRDDLKKEEGDTNEEDNDEEEDNESDKVFYDNTVSLIQSITRLHLDIKNNTVKFGGTGTNFDEVKYNRLKGMAKPSNDAAYLGMLNNRLGMAKSAVEIYTKKNDTEKVNFYKNEEAEIGKLIKEIKDKKQTTTVPAAEEEPVDKEAHENAVRLSKKGTIGQINGVTASEAFSYYDEFYVMLNEEIDANLQEDEASKSAKIAWNKVIKAYSASGIATHIQDLESLLNSNAENKKTNMKNIVDLGRKIVLNYDSYKPDGLEALIKEAIVVEDVAKSISSLSKVLLSFTDQETKGESTNNQDISWKHLILWSLGDDGKGGGAGAHIKQFIKSFNKIKEVYPDTVKNQDTNKTEVKSETQEEVKTERLISSFNKFMLIREQDEDISVNDEGENKPESPEQTKVENKPDAQTKQEEENKPEAQGQETETEQQSDSIKTSWFKFFKKGDESKWKVDKAAADEANKQLENSKGEDISTEALDKEDKDTRKKDPIIQIINLFGRAYDLYASDYIPSGRPGGRVSQKTLREYEYIGKASPGTMDNPGFGPWAAKAVYDKWQTGITKILEQERFRMILAKYKFVSQAEKDTGTEQANFDKKNQGSGRTLMTFINDMLDNKEGSFKKHRSKILTRYFGTEDIAEAKETGDGIPNGGTINADDKGPTDSPFFDQTGRTNSLIGLKSMGKKMLKVTDKDNINIMYFYPFGEQNGTKGGNCVMFKYQFCPKVNKKQSIVSNYLKNQVSSDTSPTPYKMDLISGSGASDNARLPFADNYPIYIGYIDLDTHNNSFSISNNLKIKYVEINDSLKNGNYDIKSKEIKINNIEILKVPVDKANGKQIKEDITFKQDKIVEKSNDMKIDNRKMNEIIAKFKA